jgi:hypothetical protein
MLLAGIPNWGDEEPVDQSKLKVRSWRQDVLLRAGYAPAAASLVARRFDVDLHRAADLLKAGCEEELALEILL